MLLTCACAWLQSPQLAEQAQQQAEQAQQQAEQAQQQAQQAQQQAEQAQQAVDKVQQEQQAEQAKPAVQATAQAPAEQKTNKESSSGFFSARVGLVLYAACARWNVALTWPPAVAVVIHTACSSYLQHVLSGVCQAAQDIPCCSHNYCCCLSAYVEAR
jgi:cation transport ATPase